MTIPSPKSSQPLRLSFPPLFSTARWLWRLQDTASALLQIEAAERPPELLGCPVYTVRLCEPICLNFGPLQRQLSLLIRRKVWKMGFSMVSMTKETLCGGWTYTFWRGQKIFQALKFGLWFPCSRFRGLSMPSGTKGLASSKQYQIRIRYEVMNLSCPSGGFVQQALGIREIAPIFEKNWRHKNKQQDFKQNQHPKPSQTFGWVSVLLESVFSWDFIPAGTWLQTALLLLRQFVLIEAVAGKLRHGVKWQQKKAGNHCRFWIKSHRRSTNMIQNHDWGLGIEVILSEYSIFKSVQYMIHQRHIYFKASPKKSTTIQP